MHKTTHSVESKTEVLLVRVKQSELKQIKKDAKDEKDKLKDAKDEIQALQDDLAAVKDRLDVLEASVVP